MKSPKEILLEQAAEATPALDRIRGSVVADLKPTTRQRTTVTGFFGQAWDQLFWQSRNIWGALATIWMALFIVSAAQIQPTPQANQTAQKSIPVRPAWERHHNALRAELGLPIKSDTEKPKSRKPAVIHQSRFQPEQSYV